MEVEIAMVILEFSTEHAKMNANNDSPQLFDADYRNQIIIGSAGYAETGNALATPLGSNRPPRKQRVPFPPVAHRRVHWPTAQNINY